MLSQRRALHVAIIILNKLYLGRYATPEELGRRPNAWQWSRICKMRSFYVACGFVRELLPIAPGRSGPELGACLHQLERFLEVNPELAAAYSFHEAALFQDDPALFPPERYPQLMPYKNLDVSRLRLAGSGKWPMEKFLVGGALWLPFQEPAFLFHGEDVSGAHLPNFEGESYEENLELARVWDAKGLLKVFSSPIKPGMYSRVFNAFKNLQQDRQIGDRRLPNANERHLDGPSRQLPPGHLLCQLTVPRYSHAISGSITDRRDFYHQAEVSAERARSNMLPFSYPRESLVGLAALMDFDFTREELRQHRGKRSIAGDHLGGVVDRGYDDQPRLYPAFASLFQGDHLGVEFALASHERLLQDEGLLPADQRILGHSPFPPGPSWQALVIDDFFCLSAEKRSLPATAPMPSKLWLGLGTPMIDTDLKVQLKRMWSLPENSRLQVPRLTLLKLLSILDL